MERKAVKPTDEVRAATPAFASVVARSLAAIREAAKIGPIGVSFSGGKDSLVTLHLVRQVINDAPVALFDSGCEMPATIDLARHYGADILAARLSFPEMARYSGWWGYESPVDRDCPFDVKGVLVDECAETFVVKRRLLVCALGLRAEESTGRRMNATTRGMLYQTVSRTWHLCPISHWATDDVWAYIAAHELRYHPCYDTMTAMGIPRSEQRLGASLGAINATRGRIAMLRRIDPQFFALLSTEFPELRNYV